MPDHREQFVAQLTAAQTAIHAYLMSLVLDPVEAEDLLQETNLMLWRKAEEFEAGTNFTAWACTIAHYKVREWRRSKARDRHEFNDALLDRVAARAQDRADEADQRRHALNHCLRKLAPDQREMIESRYGPGGSVSALAAALGRPAGSVSQTLYRIRQTLLECIRRTLRGDGGQA